MSEEAKCGVSRCHLPVHAPNTSDFSRSSSSNSLPWFIRTRGSPLETVPDELPHDVFLSLTTGSGLEEMKSTVNNCNCEERRRLAGETGVLFRLVICIFSCNRVPRVLCSQHTLGSPPKFHICFYLGQNNGNLCSLVEDWLGPGKRYKW